MDFLTASLVLVMSELPLSLQFCDASPALAIMNSPGMWTTNIHLFKFQEYLLNAIVKSHISKDIVNTIGARQQEKEYYLNCQDCLDHITKFGT